MEGSKRLRAWRDERRRVLRQKIDAEKALDSIDLVDQTVREKWQDMTPAQVGALRLMADNAWRKVDKFLPSPKTVENEPVEYDDIDRASIARELADIRARLAGRRDTGRVAGDSGSISESGSTH